MSIAKKSRAIGAKEHADPVGPPGQQSWMTRVSLFLAVTLTLAAGAAVAAADAGAPRSAGSPDATPSSAEISFPAPTRFALIVEGERSRQRIVGVGDVLPDSADPSHSVTLQQIEPQRIRIRDRRTARDTWVVRGAKVPGTPDRKYSRTVVLRGIEYQYVAALAPRDPEARLVRVQDERATLVIEVPPSPAAALAAVHITETAPNTYALSRVELQSALNQGGRQLLQERPEIVPDFSLHDGLSLQINTPLAAGKLSARGFEVSSPKLASLAGFEIGDVILAINGQAVNSPGDVFTLYRQAQHSSMADMTVHLERRGVPLTKVYSVR
jgi:hypothetical protein